ncbi:MAG: hypothetical protein WDN24_12680 [Sphingomonas sp.]
MGLPVHRLMGGFRDRIPISANWRLIARAAAGRRRGASRGPARARGFRAVKCRGRLPRRWRPRSRMSASCARAWDRT